MPSAHRFLIKMQPLSPATLTSLATGPFTLRPLLESIAPTPLIATSAQAWYLVEPPSALCSANPWDTCHRLVNNGFGIAGLSKPDFAEPDFEQSWTVGEDAKHLTPGADPCDPAEQSDDFPKGNHPLWYQDDEHGQFENILTALGTVPADQAVRVAHLDTGYDPHHKSLPERLEKKLQRNFVEKSRRDDATDVSNGALNNRGHGPGTLSILAGSPVRKFPHRLGAAPFVRVVPIRVANRVVLFYNSAIADALDYVHSLGKDQHTAVQVLTMSMGGLASRAWAEAVNALYDQGVVMVTAAGNNFSNKPTRNIVFPARFNRVIAACGVMADHKPYADLSGGRMAGNYGPPGRMRTAMAASTPNVPWAELGCPDTVSKDGAGTSAATPQIAAAAAIWLQKHQGNLGYSKKWMRVEAVRHALFTASNLDHRHAAQLGRGELRALAALDVAPAAEKTLKREAEDSAAFGLWKILMGLDLLSAGSDVEQMLELEALQLSQSEAIEALLPDPDADPHDFTPDKLDDIAKALMAHSDASETLRDALKARGH